MQSSNYPKSAIEMKNGAECRGWGLAGNEDLLRSVIAGCGDCIKILVLEGRLLFMSEGGKQIMEVEDFCRVKGTPWFEFWDGAAKQDAECCEVWCAFEFGAGRDRVVDNEEGTEPGFRFTWTESGGPPGWTQQGGEGFGLRLIETVLSDDFGGMARTFYRPRGLEVELVAPTIEPGSIPANDWGQDLGTVINERRIRVLVVEDDFLLRLDAVQTIEEAGFDVLEAANADEAISILEARSDINVIFADINMPGSMDGLKLAHAVRGRWPPIKIITTSGHVRVKNEDLPAGGRFISKPYSLGYVTGVIRDLVDDWTLSLVAGEVAWR
jgi:CheY-like chemotaxis protein